MTACSMDFRKLDWSYCLADGAPANMHRMIGEAAVIPVVERDFKIIGSNVTTCPSTAGIVLGRTTTFAGVKRYTIWPWSGDIESDVLGCLEQTNRALNSTAIVPENKLKDMTEAEAQQAIKTYCGLMNKALAAQEPHKSNYRPFYRGPLGRPETTPGL